MIKHPCLPVGAFHYCLPFFFLTVLLLSLLFPCSALQSAWASNQTTLANLIHKAADNWQQRDFDEMLPFINIEGGKDTEEFLRLLDSSINSINTFNGVPATQQARDKFRASILEELDARRFAQVDDILREAATKFPNLEAAVRTGSSGLRHLGKDAGGGYRPLLSDDDITFVGEGAQEAKTWFNQQVRNRGLGGVKVKGFTLNDPGKFSRQDKAILDLLDPEKFVGQSAMSGIRGETMKKGAVVLAKGPDGKLTFTRVSLADHLSSLKSTKSALDSFIDNAARKYGPLTMTASVERQIVDAHKGWDNLTGSEKVKYMLRSRKKLNESRGVASDASVSRLEEMASRFSRFPPPEMTPDEATFLLKLRRDNIVEGFKAANNRLFLQSLNARQAGGNLAANPQVREAIDELATGFAMLKDLGGKPEFKGMVDVDEMIEELIKNADGNPELKKMLYTASKQADDMLAVLRQWAGMEDEFAAMLARLPAMTPAQRAKALADRKAMLSGAGGQTRKNELALVDEMSKAAATKEGDALVVAMIKSPAGKKVLVALAMSGGAVAFSKMNERWKDGGWYNDLSSAASTLPDFLPGAMSFERMKQDGYISPGLAYQFVKESMYLTVLWPAALSADLAEMTYDATRAVTLSNYKDGLVDILETHGVFEDGRFTALKLPGGETVPRDRLAAFLKEDRTVRLANTNRPDLFYTANLSEKASEVYARHYVENDPVLNDLKKALIQQIGRINVGEAMGQITDQQWLEAAKSGFRLLFAIEGVCTKLPKQWCELVTIYQNKIKDRADDIFPNVMVPHLISLAEDAHKALTGSDEAVKQIMKIQRELESLRGSPLGVDLAQEAAQRAAKAGDLRATSISGDTSTKRDKALAEGGYLQAALKAYETILKEASDTLNDIVERTGYKEAKVLAFPFSGNFFQDAAKARQSRRGFMAATNAIVQDVGKIKGSAPDVLDETDLKALGILAEVAYRNRAALDAANSAKVDTPKDSAATPIPDLLPPMAGKDSPYHAWYKDALEKVKALYAKAVDLKKLVAKGVMLVPPGKEMIERVPGVFEARITDPALRTMFNEGKVIVEWASDQYGAAFSDKRSLKTSCTPDEPGQATVQATFSLKAEPAAEASVHTKVTVRPAEKPSVSLTLHPSTPQAGGTVTASASPDSTSARRPLGYEWSCENCQIVDRRGSQAMIRAPEQGGAEVSVRMKRDDGKELAQASARFTVAAPPDDKKDPPKPKTDKDAQDDKDAKGSKEGKGDKTSGPDQPGADGKTPLDKTPGPVFPPVPPVTPPPAVVPPSTVTPQGQTGAQPTKPGDQGQPPKTGQPGADVQKPSTGADSGQKPLVPEDPQRPKDKEAKDPAIDLSDMVDSLSSKSGVESWREALSLRAEMKKKLAVPSLAAKEKRAYEERLQYAEGMLKHYWNNARSNFDGLPEHLARWRDEAGRAYDDVLKNQPKASGPAAPRKPSSQFEPSDEGMKPVPLEQAAPSKAFERRQGPVTKVNPAGDERKGYHSSTVTNLEGETPDSVPDVFDKACFERVKRARDEYVGRLDQRAREAKAIWDILSGRGDPDAGYEAAMTRADQFWMNAGGVPPFDWKTKPVQVYVETCGGPSRKVDIAPPKQSAPPALKVELRIDGKQSAPGKPVTVVAMALGGKPPYTYVFKGAETSRENSATYAIPEGKKHVVARVQAFDSAGQTAYGDLSLAGEAVTLKLGKTAPAGNALAAGAEARFEAQLMSEGKPADASAFVIRWEPSTEARFARNEGQGLLTNTATFTRPGKVKVWAVALRKDGAALTTVAESNQIELEVAGTSITLTASPAEPLVGQEVTVTAVENPKVLDADAAYWWDDSQGGAGTGPTANQRQWKFTVKEAKPVTVNAMLKGKKGGEDLARASLTVTPKSYQVTAVSLGHTWGGETTRPVVWKPGVGLVALDKEIAAHMDVGLRADVSPAPPQGQALRYKWTVNEGSTLSGNPASRETRAQRSSKGTIEAKVEVRDGNNALLGTGSVSVPVTVSDEDIKQGKAKAQELEKLKQEAAAAWNAGDIDLACGKA
ncbi:MAG: hypothetical protein HY915_16060, partial [Desulfovibrio sp.]|nr:hypothetical protein [Desulfovibrio sp.]